MDIYIEFKSVHILKKQVVILEKQANCEKLLKLHIICNKRVKIFMLMAFAKISKFVKSIEIIVSPRNISKRLVKFVNTQYRISLVYVCCEKLFSQQKRSFSQKSNEKNRLLAQF